MQISVLEEQAHPSQMTHADTYPLRADCIKPLLFLKKKRVVATTFLKAFLTDGSEFLEKNACHLGITTYFPLRYTDFRTAFH